MLKQQTNAVKQHSRRPKDTDYDIREVEKCVGRKEPMTLSLGRQRTVSCFPTGSDGTRRPTARLPGVALAEHRALRGTLAAAGKSLGTAALRRRWLPSRLSVGSIFSSAPAAEAATSIICPHQKTRGRPEGFPPFTQAQTRGARGPARSCREAANVETSVSVSPSDRGARRGTVTQHEWRGVPKGDRDGSAVPFLRSCLKARPKTLKSQPASRQRSHLRCAWPDSLLLLCPNTRAWYSPVPSGSRRPSVLPYEPISPVLDPESQLSSCHLLGAEPGKQQREERERVDNHCSNPPNAPTNSTWAQHRC
ncbi:uncharacterized protein [Struthio camelus]|uniref:uncharacterized protein isoform X1 n=1 Tax=Struthio camelus TaxID=8801 RepID=UPI0036041169